VTSCPDEEVATVDDPASPPAGDLFCESLIASYVDDSRFVERPWLRERIESALAGDDCRFLLLRAEPGLGKTALVAWLARRHPDWPRYFIRRDQVSPLGPPGGRSLFLQVGLQLAARYPQLFSAPQIEITIRQRLGTLGHDATVVGAEVERLIASPFMQAALRVTQEVDRVEGQLKGLVVREWIADSRLIREDDLRHMALLDPAAAVLRQDPARWIVILVDALDELRYQGSEGDLLHWLANVSPVPENVRFVLTSRPDDELLRTLRAKQAACLTEIDLDPADPEFHDDIERDLVAYARRLVQVPGAERALEAAGRSSADFVATAVAKAEGNLGYLDAIGRALDRALAQDDPARLAGLVRLDDLPPRLEELYAFFLQQVKDQVRDRSVAVEDPQSGQFRQAAAWPAADSRILGVLCVAREPLAAGQVRSLGQIQVVWDEFVAAVDRLRQFLDEEDGRYRFYHATWPEFLTHPSTQANPETRDLYQEPAAWHRRIVQYYRRLVGGWAVVDGYGWRHLTAHAEQAGPGDLLFDLCDGGFLAAKRQAVASVAALEEDWNRVFHACRAGNQFARFVRYGLQRSLQSSEIAYLQNTRAATAAARLAGRAGDGAAAERLATEMALISHPLARIGAEQALFEVLLDGMPAHPLVDELDRRLRAALSSLPPGDDRDRYLAGYVRAVARSRRPGWQDIGTGYLDDVAGLLPRVSLVAALAQGHAGEGQPARAAALLHQALEACGRFDLGGDDIVPGILEAAFGAERVHPAQWLAASLEAILEAAPSLCQPDCAEIVRAALDQVGCVTDEIACVWLGTMAVRALDGAGLHDEAHTLAGRLLEEYLGDEEGTEMADVDEEPVPDWAAEAMALLDSPGYASRAIALFNLLPVAWYVADAARLETWHRRVDEALKGVTSASDLLQVAGAAADLANQAVAEPVLDRMLRQVGARVLEIPTGEVGFAIVAELAVGDARVGERARARHLLTQILDQVTAEALGPAGYPEQSRGRAAGMAAAWMAACLIGERDLVERVLDWLVQIAPHTLWRDDRAALWADGIAALIHLPDLELAGHLFERLRLFAVEVMDAANYFASACWQLADAYLGVGLPEEARRLLAEGVRVAQRAVEGQILVDHLARAAYLYGLLDDVESCSRLVQQALETIPAIEGDNIQAGCLQQVLPALDVLSECGEPGREGAVRLLEQATRVAEGIGLAEYTVLALSDIVRLGVERSLPGPARALARVARLHLRGDDPNRLRVVGQAVHALHRAGSNPARPGRRLLFGPGAWDGAGAGRAAQQLLGEWERAVGRLPDGSDGERASVCQACANLVALYHALGDGRPSQPWRERAAAVAEQTQEPDWRTDACLAVARIEALDGRAREAAAWLADGIASWHRVDEWLYASLRVDALFDVWAAIPSDEERRALVDRMSSVLWRVPDLVRRDALQARLALAFLHTPSYCEELVEPVASQGGIDVLLTALHAADVVPEGILPGMLYHLLVKSSRQPRPAFAGNSLLATQAGVRHGLFTGETAVPVLEMLEATIREISRQGGPR
jgi:tetratricopeptide (TPR) repeat protein